MEEHLCEYGDLSVFELLESFRDWYDLWQVGRIMEKLSAGLPMVGGWFDTSKCEEYEIFGSFYSTPIRAAVICESLTIQFK